MAFGHNSIPIPIPTPIPINFHPRGWADVSHERLRSRQGFGPGLQQIPEGRPHGHVAQIELLDGADQGLDLLVQGNPLIDEDHILSPDSAEASGEEIRIVRHGLIAQLDVQFLSQFLEKAQEGSWIQGPLPQILIRIRVKPVASVSCLAPVPEPHRPNDAGPPFPRR